MRVFVSRGIGLVVILLFTACLSWAATTANITVNATNSLGPVNPLIFGHNVEAGAYNGCYNWSETGEGLWDGTKRAPVPEVVQMSKAAGMKMLRYPGGCLTSLFNWHEAVGPISTRPHFLFGIDEFIAYCRAVGAEPLMSVSDHICSPQDAADLVEYLNAPADARHPWAQKRARWGHPQPYHVRYFEYGNESDLVKLFTPETYAEKYLASAKLMRAVDPTIQLGIQLGMTLDWSAHVLSTVKGNADFIIAHVYPVQCGEGAAQSIPTEQLMQACMAAPDQVELKLRQYNDLIWQYTGKNIPLAITEYNCLCAQEQPIPYRFTLGTALCSADMVRVMLKPTSNVRMANYWQFINGYWGMVQGPVYVAREPHIWKKMPAYYLFRLWGEHFGAQLVSANVDSPTVELPTSVLDIHQATGERYIPPRALDNNVVNLCDGALRLTPSAPGVTTAVNPDGTLTATMDHLNKETYLPFCVIKAPIVGSCRYILSFEARSRGDITGALGLGIDDSRGYPATFSGWNVEGVQNAKDWTKFECALTSLPDCTGVALSWRFLPGGNGFTGVEEVRNLRVTAYEAGRCVDYPAYPAITTAASRSADGRTLYLMVFNRHHAEAIPTTIQINGFGPVTRVRRWMVTGPSLSSTNLKSEEVREMESGVVMPITAQGGLTYTAPAHSMTAIEITR